MNYAKYANIGGYSEITRSSTRQKMLQSANANVSIVNRCRLLVLSRGEVKRLQELMLNKEEKLESKSDPRNKLAIQHSITS